MAKTEKRISKFLDKLLKKEKETRMKDPINKVLLLGPGDSGKTTLLKQMKILHGDGFSAQERQDMKLKIIENILVSMKKLVQAVVVFGYAFQLPSNNKHASLIDSVDIPSVLASKTLSSDVSEALSSLWQDEAIQRCFQRGNEFSLQDNAFYFLSNLSRFVQPDFAPTDQNILMVRSRTTKASETDFRIKGQLYRIVDVGGQKSYRAAWAVFFDDAKAILFIASLASYDQMLEEDGKTNRMADAMKLFDVTCNNPIVKKVAVILLLNKSDLAEKKIQESSVRKHFPDLSEKKNEKDFQVIKTYFKKKFEHLNKVANKDTYTHFTTNTDTDIMKAMIAMIMDIVMKMGLGDAGFF